MNKLIRFCIKHQIPVFMAVIAFFVIGIFSAFTMKVDFLPTLQKRKLLVSVEYEGISAKEIKSLVTIPLEDSLGSLTGLKKISSVSRDGLSLISVEFHWGTDIDIALVECRELIDAAYSVLPARCKKPSVKAIESINESLTIAMIPLDNDLKYGRYIADYDIKPRFQRVNGVGLVSISGGEKEQIEVRVSKDKLDSHQLTLETISNVISAANFEYPAGTINEGEKKLSVKTSGLYTDINQIGKTPILYNEGGLLRLSDIAEVVDSVKEKETFFLYQGKECIKIGIKKNNDASPLKLSKEIKSEINSLKDLYGNYYSFEIINDLSEQIKSSIMSLLVSAIIGCITVFLVILYFLKSVRLSIIISTVIPVCSVVSISLLSIFGKSINIMSLSGLAIGLGMVIDCSAVVIENIQKKYISIAESNQKSTLSDFEIISSAVEEVAKSNIGSTATTVIVFIPVFFLKGILGELFTDLAIAIISSITVSCILSLTYIPAMCSLNPKFLKKSIKNPKLVDYLEKKYRKNLFSLFRKKGIVFIIIFLCFAVGIGSLFFIKFELLPSLNSNTVIADISFPQGSTIKNIQEKSVFVQENLSKINNVKSISISGGVESDDYEYLSSQSAVKEKVRFTVVTKGNSNTKQEVINLFNNLRDDVSISNKTDLLSEILEINNNDYVVWADSEDELSESLKKYSDIEYQLQPNLIDSEYTFIPDRVANARFSVSALSTANLAYSLLEGIQSAPFYKDGRQIPILVKINKDDIKTVDDLENSYVQLENSILPLKNFGRVEIKQNEKILYRYNRKDAKILHDAKFESEPADENIISLKKNDITEMIGDGSILIIIVILLLYLVMGAQFESFSIPFILMIALPPAFSGAFLFLFLFNQTLNINSIIALVVLFGTSVNNTILLYESCTLNSKITQNSIIRNCVSKLRSLLVTNLTTIFALIPFAVDPKHVNAQSSMSLAIIGGLIVSLVLVLFVIPVLFTKTLKNKENLNE